MIDVTKLTKQSFARQVGIVAKMKGAIEQMTKEKPGCRLTEWAFLLNNGFTSNVGSCSHITALSTCQRQGYSILELIMKPSWCLCLSCLIIGSFSGCSPESPDSPKTVSSADNAPALSAPSAQVEKLKVAEDTVTGGSPGSPEDVSAPITEPTVSAPGVSQDSNSSKKAADDSPFALPEGGVPPVLVASLKSGDVAAVQEALNQGQDIHARLHDGSTMLHIATSAAQKEVVELLLQSGADANTPWTQARVTAIHLAAVYGQAPLLELFKQYGADFLVATAEGETALHLAAKVRHSAEAMTTLTSFLTEQGCSTNTQDKDGNTALHEAAKAGNGIAVQALLKLNADRTLTNLEGKKAAELTTDASVVALLED